MKNSHSDESPLVQVITPKHGVLKFHVNAKGKTDREALTKSLDNFGIDTRNLRIYYHTKQDWRHGLKVGDRIDFHSNEWFPAIIKECNDSELEVTLDPKQGVSSTELVTRNSKQIAQLGVFCKQDDDRPLFCQCLDFVLRSDDTPTIKLPMEISPIKDFEFVDAAAVRLTSGTFLRLSSDAQDRETEKWSQEISFDKWDLVTKFAQGFSLTNLLTSLVRVLGFLLTKVSTLPDDQQTSFIRCLYYNTTNPESPKFLPSILDLIQRSVSYQQDKNRRTISTLRESGITGTIIKIIVDSLKYGITDAPGLPTQTESFELDNQVAISQHEFSLIETILGNSDVECLKTYQSILLELGKAIDGTHKTSPDESDSSRKHEKTRLWEFRENLTGSWAERFLKVAQEAPRKRHAEVLRLTLEISTLLPPTLAQRHLENCAPALKTIFAIGHLMTHNVDVPVELLRMYRIQMDLSLGVQDYAMQESFLRGVNMHYSVWEDSSVVKFLQSLPKILQIIRSYRPPGVLVFAKIDGESKIDEEERMETLLKRRGAKYRALELVFGSDKLSSMMSKMVKPLDHIEIIADIAHEILLLFLVDVSEIHCLPILMSTFESLIRRVSGKKISQKTSILLKHFSDIENVLKHFIAIVPLLEDQPNILHTIVFPCLNSFLVQIATSLVKRRDLLEKLTRLLVACQARLGSNQSINMFRLLKLVADDKPEVLASYSAAMFHILKQHDVHSLLIPIQAIPFGLHAKTLSENVPFLIDLMSRDNISQQYCEIIQDILGQISQSNPRCLESHIGKLCDMFFEQDLKRFCHLPQTFRFYSAYDASCFSEYMDQLRTLLESKGFASFIIEVLSMVGQLSESLCTQSLDCLAMYTKQPLPTAKKVKALQLLLKAARNHPDCLLQHIDLLNEMQSDTTRFISNSAQNVIAFANHKPLSLATKALFRQTDKDRENLHSLDVSDQIPQDMDILNQKMCEAPVTLQAKSQSEHKTDYDVAIQIDIQQEFWRLGKEEDGFGGTPYWKYQTMAEGIDSEAILNRNEIYDLQKELDSKSEDFVDHLYVVLPEIPIPSNFTVNKGSLILHFECALNTPLCWYPDPLQVQAKDTNLWLRVALASIISGSGSKFEDSSDDTLLPMRKYWEECNKNADFKEFVNQDFLSEDEIEELKEECKAQKLFDQLIFRPDFMHWACICCNQEYDRGMADTAPTPSMISNAAGQLEKTKTLLREADSLQPIDEFQRGYQSDEEEELEDQEEFLDIPSPLSDSSSTEFGMKSSVDSLNMQIAELRSPSTQSNNSDFPHRDFAFSESVIKLPERELTSTSAGSPTYKYDPTTVKYQAGEDKHLKSHAAPQKRISGFVIGTMDGDPQPPSPPNRRTAEETYDQKPVIQTQKSSFKVIKLNITRSNSSEDISIPPSPSQNPPPPPPRKPREPLRIKKETNVKSQHSQAAFGDEDSSSTSYKPESLRILPPHGRTSSCDAEDGSTNSDRSGPHERQLQGDVNESDDSDVSTDDYTSDELDGFDGYHSRNPAGQNLPHRPTVPRPAPPSTPPPPSPRLATNSDSKEACVPSTDDEEVPTAPKRIPGRNVPMVGWLHKKNPGGMKGMRMWKRRWCVMEGDELQYFAKPEDSDPRGRIDFDRVLEVDRASKQSKHDTRFQITLSKSQRVYEFKCDTKDACDQWIQALQRKLPDAGGA